jgi:SAM-dependent methyltransferase
MNIFLCPKRDEMGKFHGIVQAFPTIWEGSILDVGCRSTHLKHALPNGGMRYHGVDLFSPAHVVGNVEIGLPFGDMSFDVVVALDVLEHTDDIYHAFSELCRVARRHVVCSLPNGYEVKSRLKFLLGQRPSGKHGLPVEPPGDRHRWLFSFLEARTFTHGMALRHALAVRAEGCLVGPRRGAAGVGRLVSLFPNLLSPFYIALLEKRGMR